MIRNCSNTWIRVTGLALASLLPLAAQKPVTDTPAKTSKQAQPQPSKKPQAEVSPGMRVFRDPVTGEFRDGEATEVQALTPGAGLTDSAVIGTPHQSFNLRSGGVALQVDSSTMSYSVARIGPDGKLVMECVTGEKAAKKALTTPAAPVTIQRHNHLEEK